MAGNRMLLHLKLPDDDLVSACGVRIPPSNLTEVEDEVSCMSCQRHFNPVSRPYTPKKASDPQFKGTGALSCYACGREIRVHPGWPCPFRPSGALTPPK